MKRNIFLLLTCLKLLLFISLYIILFVLNRPSGIDILWVFIIEIVAILFEILSFVFFHELGHFVFGLLSGYSLTMFKIGPFEFVKNENNKINFSFDLSANFALGQCLMYPPKPKKHKKTPFFWYNGGGLIFSYLILLLQIGLYFIPNFYVKHFMIPSIVISLFLCYQNSIYTKNGFNDVCNAIFLRKNPQYIDSLMYQLEVTGNLVRGKRYGKKTKYKCFYEEKLNHISLPAVLFKYYYAIDHDDFLMAMECYDLLKKNYYNLIFPLQRAIVALEIMWGDLVLKKSIKIFRRDFNNLGQREKNVLLKNQKSDMGIMYRIYESIYDNNNFYRQLNELTECKDLQSGELLSIKKKFDILKNVLKENGDLK